MDLLLRIIQFIVKILNIIVDIILAIVGRRKSNEGLPPIKDKLLTLPLVIIVKQLRNRQLSSTHLVGLYIERIKEVNTYINAVVEDRYEAAIAEAKRADDLIAKCPNNQLAQLFSRYPILGVPFTVKEACGVKGMSQVVGSLQRVGVKAKSDNAAVENLRSAGGIPLLVSANPEYCFSIETSSHVNGTCLNPYDFRRTCGGSSGGEGALNGSGSTLFGIGTDIAGSIRIPCLFNGVFGHKPTGGLIPNSGIFPSTDNADCTQYLQTGPITRFAGDLSLILHIMAGNNAEKLDLTTPVETQHIKIFYSFGFSGVNGLLHHHVEDDIQICIMKAVHILKQSGLATEAVDIKGFRNSTEIALSGIARLVDLPYLQPDGTSALNTFFQLILSTCKRTQYTKNGLIFELMRRTHAFMTPNKLLKFKNEAENLKKEIINLLDPNGVLFFPTFPVAAIHHHTSVLSQWAIDYPLIFNILGLPATHVPMGLDSRGLPIGFQVVACPFKDKLCLQIASALESAFGGWAPPVQNAFETN